MMPASIDPSASYAAEVARLLWPSPWEPPQVTRRRHSDGAAHRDAYLFPSVRHPRLLVPADLPGSATMLRRLGTGHPMIGQPVRTLAERSVASRAFAHVRWPVLRVAAPDLAADSIEHHLSTCLGTDVRVGVLLGTRRVNQKPVLQVFDVAGGLLGFAKVGHNELTAALVRREAGSLARLAELAPRSFEPPRVLHHGRWRGLEVLVVSPLVTDPRLEVSPEARTTAMREVAHLAGTAVLPLVASEFWARLRQAAALATDGPDGARLHRALSAVETSHGDDLVHLGGWHGDWGRWNMGMGGRTLMLWDWERYDASVPVGFDGLHFLAQRVRPGQRQASRQEEELLRKAPEALEALGVPRPQHDITLRLYLLEVAVRYVQALTHGETPALRRRTAWVLSLLERLAEHPTTSSAKGLS